MVQLQTNMVSLADNYAMGVAASATMRIRSAESISQEITIMQLQKVELQKQYELSAKRKEGPEKALYWENLILDVNNKIVSAQQKQAEQLKALRDGYVSAISAMNIGAGRFTKILISQEQNIAAGIQQGVVISSYTGAYGRNAGFMGGSTFRAGGLGLTDQMAMGGAYASAGALPYYTGRGREDYARSLLASSRADWQRNITQQGIMMQERSAAMIGGGAAAMSFQGQAAGGGAPGITNVPGGGFRTIGRGGFGGGPPITTGSVAPGMVATRVQPVTIPKLSIEINLKDIEILPKMIIEGFRDLITTTTKVITGEGSAVTPAAPIRWWATVPGR
jgi:hypothetical protein